MRIAAISALLLTGCGAHVQVVSHAIAPEVSGRVEDSSAPAQELIDAEIVVVVTSPQQPLTLANSREDSRTFETFERPAAVGPNGDPSLDSSEALHEQMHRERGTTMVQELVDARAVFAALLERELRKHFRSVRVPLEAEPGFRVRLEGSMRIALTKTAEFRALTSGGPVPIPDVEGHGQRRTGPHLAWGIPVILIGGLVIGTAIVSPIFAKISRSHLVGSAGDALRAVAERWAQAAADAWRANGGFPVPVPATAGPAPRASTGTAEPVPCPGGGADGGCGTGFICHEGRCLSACNPACAANEYCAGLGVCASACNPPCPTGTECTEDLTCVRP